MCELQVNSRWKDNRGELVTVTDTVFNRVLFVRDGYKFPVTYSPERFVKEFSFVSEGISK